MIVIHSKDTGFGKVLAGIKARGEFDTSRVEEYVKAILKDVRERGDEAVSEYTEKFDGISIKGSFEVPPGELERAFKKIPRRDIELLDLAARRIEDFHRRDLKNSWFFTDEAGVTLGVKVTPIERVGIYVPGGTAPYPSTVLMNAIPARLAGVDEIIMATPGASNPYVLAAARIAGVGRVFRIGGVQAIGAFAYGTKSVPKVDKITGPGNIYVATAKRLVFGSVSIDMIAGPSEILIINDGSGDASTIAADLLSQAEHDEVSSSILVTTSEDMAALVEKEVERQLKELKRRSIAEASLRNYGAVIVVRSLEEAAFISNEIAPEHLELFVERPFELLGLIRNAGAIFLGRFSPEAAGDYLAGPNHTLPTGGTARFFSPLSVEDFMKRSSIISFSEKGIGALGKDIERFSELEGLEGHARSVRERIRGK